ncbi:MAG: LacI family DNA-binding transcriptional regulator, partial [Bacteroidota bacterium]
MAKKVTIKDIARELNTNDSTVSRALNDSPLVSLRTKELVKKKAAEMGYRRNSIARQLREGKSRTLGLLVPRINRAFFANVIHGVETVAKQKGYQVLICQSNDTVEEERDAIRTLGEQKVAGIIVSRAADAGEEDFYQEVIEDGIALVMFDRVLKSLHTHQVINANKEASYTAVKHLIDQGYC